MSKPAAETISSGGSPETEPPERFDEAAIPFCRFLARTFFFARRFLDDIAPQKVSPTIDWFQPGTRGQIPLLAYERGIADLLSGFQGLEVAREGDRARVPNGPQGGLP